MNFIAVFFLKIFGAIIGNALRPSYSFHQKSYVNLSNMDKVKQLETWRIKNGHRKGWLYYKCKEQDLLNEYYQLYPKQTNVIKNTTIADIDNTMFSFGKYRGILVKDVWNSDKHYIQWLFNNVNLDDYPNEEYVLEYLKNNNII